MALQVGGARQLEWQAVERFCNPRRLDRFDGCSGRQSSAGRQMNCRIKRAVQRRDVCSGSFAPANMIGRVIWWTRGTQAVGPTPENGMTAQCTYGTRCVSASAALSAVVY